MDRYSEQGYRLETLWHKDKWVKTSIDKWDSKGGLLVGRVDVTWDFWHDKDVLVHKYVVHKSDGTIEKFDQQGFELFMAFTHREFTSKSFTGYFNRESFRVGIIAVELEFIDLKGWIKVFPITEGVSTGNNTLVMWNVIPKKDFKVVIKIDSDYDDGEITYDLPFTPKQTFTWINFDVGVSCKLKMESDTQAWLQTVGGAKQFSEVWYKYK